MLWKKERRKQAGRPIREESQENSAGRPAEFCGDAKLGSTRAEAVQRFNVSRWRVDQASKLLHADRELERVHPGLSMAAPWKQANKKQAGRPIREECRKIRQDVLPDFAAMSNTPPGPPTRTDLTSARRRAEVGSDAKLAPTAPRPPSASMSQGGDEQEPEAGVKCQTLAQNLLRTVLAGQV